jgi:hypothetical protein
LPPIEEFDYPAYDVRSSRAAQDAAKDERQPQQERRRAPSYGSDAYASVDSAPDGYAGEAPAQQEYAQDSYARPEPARDDLYARPAPVREDRYARAPARDDRYSRYAGERYAFSQPQTEDDRDTYNQAPAPYPDRYEDRDRYAYPASEGGGNAPRDYYDRDYP